jgi:hypothetical protein
VEFILEEEVVEGGGWVEEVDVDVSLYGDRCCWVFCVNLVNCCLQVLYEVWVSFWSSVDVDNCVSWAVFLFGIVDIEDYWCCVWYLYGFVDCGVEVVFVSMDMPVWCVCV